MRSNYKKIGAYIQLVDERNRGLKVSLLLGLSIDKIFIPSVANTVGTNMANYKIIRKGQFACSLMQVRRDKKIPVALLRNHEEALISQAYPVFEITDIEQLLPEYLMMWMSRSEFDRHACFLAVGGVRGSLEWDDFCDMELPIPSPEKQQEIVGEYNVIVDRIKLNEQLNQKLEKTAQAIYKHWFVDFEFPVSVEYATSIGKPELEGKPYRSNNGKMIFSDELDKEIPIDWKDGLLEELIDIQNGYAFKSCDFFVSGTYPIIKIKNITPPNIDLSESQFWNGCMDDKQKKYLIESGDILISMTGSTMNQMNSAVGQVGRYTLDSPSLINQRVANLKPKPETESREFVYQFISSKETHLELLMGSTGSANQANISPDQIKQLKIAVPSKEILSQFEAIVSKIMNRRKLNNQTGGLLDYLQSVVKLNSLRGSS